jgi:hypothetical protein
MSLKMDAVSKSPSKLVSMSEPSAFALEGMPTAQKSLASRVLNVLGMPTAQKSLASRVFSAFMFGLKTTVIAGGLAGGAALMTMCNPICLGIGGACIFSSVVFAAVELKLSSNAKHKKQQKYMERNLQKQHMLIENHKNIVIAANEQVKALSVETSKISNSVVEMDRQLAEISDTNNNLSRCSDTLNREVDVLKNENEVHKGLIERSSEMINNHIDSLKSVSDSLASFSQSFMNLFLRFKNVMDSLQERAEKKIVEFSEDSSVISIEVEKREEDVIDCETQTDLENTETVKTEPVKPEPKKTDTKKKEPKKTEPKKKEDDKTVTEIAASSFRKGVESFFGVGGDVGVGGEVIRIQLDPTTDSSKKYKTKTYAVVSEG